MFTVTNDFPSLLYETTSAKGHSQRLKFNIHISQGSVARDMRWGGIFCMCLFM